jgi:hypothetical protein
LSFARHQLIELQEQSTSFKGVIRAPWLFPIESVAQLKQLENQGLVNRVAGRIQQIVHTSTFLLNIALRVTLVCACAKECAICAKENIQNTGYYYSFVNHGVK